MTAPRHEALPDHKLLIDRAGMEKYFHLSKGVDPCRLNRHILEAQMFDLKPLVHPGFYRHLMDPVENDARFWALLKGFEYPYQGRPLRCEGLRAALAQFVYARYILKSNIVDTPFGFVQKIDESSIPLECAEREKLYRRYRNQGFELFEDFKRHIQRNLAVYPEWEAPREVRQESRHISTVIK